ncbi:ATPase, T2SS/T4P/T4SS family [Pseudomonas sp. JG-B]|uniref:ATPase, T2SS/T4P/T4SS family n=1 Tax=Pseudomonas sp. JG-B TaxID=2603214 RepID=UPI0015B6E61B
MVVRLLSEGGPLRGYKELGFHPEQVVLLNKLVIRKDGIVLVTGTTGSGKSTTLQTSMELVLRHFDGKINLVTVRRPD